MTIASVLASGRRAAEARMTSRATIRRPRVNEAGSPVYTTNEAGYDVPAWDTVYSDLPCRIDSAGSDGGSRGVTVGGVTYENATGVAHFPAPSPLLADGDLIHVTSGEWPDEVYRIVAAVKYDQKTARKLPIAEADRPEEWA